MPDEKVQAQCCEEIDAEAIFLKLGRSRAREHLFQDCVWGAVGRLVDQIREERNRLRGERNEPELTHTNIADFCNKRFKLARHLTREFLNGSTPRANARWGEIAPVMLAFVLCGRVKAEGQDRKARNKRAATDSEQVEKETAVEFDEKHLPVQVRELISFFLLNNPREREMPDPSLYEPKSDKWDMPENKWYFGPFIPKQPVTTREVYREWDITRKKIESNVISDVRMVRVGSVDHFRMVIPLDAAGYKISPTGLELAKCIDKGVEQVFIYPANDIFSKAPRESVESFVKSLNAKDAALVKIAEIPLNTPPKKGAADRVRFSFEPFGHHFRWVWYQWKESDGRRPSRLWVSRHPKHGPCLFDTEDDDKELFEEWLQLFAYEHVKDVKQGKKVAKSLRTIRK